MNVTSKNKYNKNYKLTRGATVFWRMIDDEISCLTDSTDSNIYWMDFNVSFLFPTILTNESNLRRKIKDLRQMADVAERHALTT